MSDVSSEALPALLDDVRRELGAAVDELERSRAAHRQVESLLLAVLEHVPVPLLVVDEEQRVRAVSAAAARAWGAHLDAALSGIDGLDDAVADACREAFAVGHVTSETMPPAFGAALLDEPGTGVRYVVVWSEHGEGTDG